jgi:hypothetical protein
MQNKSRAPPVRLALGITTLALLASIGSPSPSDSTPFPHALAGQLRREGILRREKKSHHQHPIASDEPVEITDADESDSDSQESSKSDSSASDSPELSDSLSDLSTDSISESDSDSDSDSSDNLNASDLDADAVLHHPPTSQAIHPPQSHHVSESHLSPASFAESSAEKSELNYARDIDPLGIVDPDSETGRALVLYFNSTGRGSSSLGYHGYDEDIEDSEPLKPYANNVNDHSGNYEYNSASGEPGASSYSEDSPYSDYDSYSEDSPYSEDSHPSDLKSDFSKFSPAHFVPYSSDEHPSDEHPSDFSKFSPEHFGSLGHSVDGEESDHFSTKIPSKFFPDHWSVDGFSGADDALIEVEGKGRVGHGVWQIWQLQAT